jgi:hypothetical protein
MNSALVAIRLHRWSVGAMAVLSVLLAGLCTWLAWDISSGVATCQQGIGAPGCQELHTSGTFRSQDVVKVIGVLGFLPFIGGTLLGAPLVAREVEQRTASLAWPLAISRLNWLFRVAGPVIGLGALMTVLPAFAGVLLVSSYAPEMNPWRTFEHFGLYGPALVIRFVAVSAIGLLAGVWLGRTLPALIASATGAAALFFVLSATYSHWLPALELPHSEAPADSLGQLFVRQMVRMSDGQLVPIEEGLVIDPDLGDVTESVEFGLPADQAPDVAWREDAALFAGSTVVGTITILALRRRRPY